MLRMGRSPKVESNEPQQPAQPSPQPQPAQSYAQPTPQTYETPARAASATPATPAAAATPSTPRAVTESEALARDLRDGVVSGFIGGGTVVSGDAEFKGMLRIDGHFTGRVRSEKGALIVQTLHPLVATGDLPYVDGWRTGSWAGFSADFTDPAPWYFRTIESWVRLFSESGFHILEVREPLHPKTQKPASALFIAEVSG